ncbi:MAG TPA: M12 family metallo-peptidase, partial [Pyrinomonadaceae bacterium]|nr:M12 family metallo-peptidase [Pyrinomonadaceae bacterium]
GGAVHSIDMQLAAPVHTFRGKVRGMKGAEARFTIDDEKIEGVIITSDERYYVEPRRNYSELTDGPLATGGGSAKLSSATDYVFYKGSDVIEGAEGVCGTTMDGKLKAEIGRLAPEAALKANETFLATGNRQVELATEADFEYVNYFGSSAAANTEILNIMNQVDGLYQAEMGITFQIIYQHTWATSNDPYSTTVSDGILTEFTNYWNANITQPRDLAHMWTGKQMDGNIAGIAWMGTLCQYSATYAYGVSMRVTSGAKSSIAAHEIGHNLGASHPDQQAPPVVACANTVMNSTVGQAFDFCQFSRDEMNAYLATNSGCLTIVSTPSTMQFNAANYPVNEGAGSVVVTVTRPGDVSAAASVDYATSNGTASVGSDYAAAAGTLHFAAGDAVKTFPIFIIDDAYVEGPETINVALSNPTGGALGAQSSATVTIIDNDVAPPSGNPLEGAQFFVRQHYLDFLNRDADQAGLSYWTSSLTNCGGNAVCLNAGHTSVSAAFFIESEFQETGYYVYRIYKAGLGRRPVFDEFAADRSRVVGNPDLAASKQALAADFVTRSAFVVQYPVSIAPELYLDQLNANTAGSLTQAERDTLVNGMKSGTETRATVLQKVAENQLFRQREYNSAFVSMQYFGYLRRDPDQGGYNFWLNVLNGSTPVNFRGMVCSFLTATEYQLRFSPVVTRSNSECSQ